MAGVLAVGAAVFVLYIISYALAHFRKLHVATHRKIWNAALVLSFIATAATGAYMILFSEAGLRFSLPFDALSVHKMAGLAFIIIGIFHSAWHIPYFKAYLPRQQPPAPA